MRNVIIYASVIIASVIIASVIIWSVIYMKCNYMNCNYMKCDYMKCDYMKCKYMKLACVHLLHNWCFIFVGQFKTYLESKSRLPIPQFYGSYFSVWYIIYILYTVQKILKISKEFTEANHIPSNIHKINTLISLLIRKQALARIITHFSLIIDKNYINYFFSLK